MTTTDLKEHNQSINLAAKYL